MMLFSITIELRITAPFCTFTERNKIEFSTVPSITQPSAIIEFFTLAISQIDDDSPCAEAWFSKLDQTLIKAKMTFGDTEDYQYLKQLYDKAKKTKRLTDNKNQFTGIIGIIMPAFVALLGIIFLTIGIFIKSSVFMLIVTNDTYPVNRVKKVKAFI